jgi:predicted ribosomally synthesized peptide with SipW-like signal peptide
MNSKLLKASLAGVAAIAVAAGGSTFASWTDTGSISDNSVATGILKLNLNSKNGTSAVVPLNAGSLAPGMGWGTNVWIASSDGASVPSALLSVSVKNIRDFENGCGSTNSEAAVDSTCVSSLPGDGTLGGELSNALGTDLYAWTPATPGACTEYPGSGSPTVSLIHSSILKTKENQVLNIGVLNHGDGRCVRLEQYLPSTAGDNVQSDSVKYDLAFTLAQQ